MKNQSVTLAVYKMSNDSVGIGIDQNEFENYVKHLNMYQKNPVTYYKQEKKYSHVKNNDLLCAVKDYFKDKKTFIFNKEDGINSISDFEMVLLKNKPDLKIENFEHENALQFLKEHNLLDIFLQAKLEKNITSYYNEYSRSFSERINIKNTKEPILDLQEVENYLANSVLMDEYKNASVYHYSREVRLVSFSYDRYHTYIDDNTKWVKNLFEKHKNKNNGFPYAQGQVFENSFLELFKIINNDTNKKNSLK